MFLQRIPYQSVRRRRIRNWLLLLLRAGGARADRRGVRAAVLRAGRRSPAGAVGGAREVVDPARSARPAWGTAITGSARRRPRDRRSTALGARRPRDARALRHATPRRAMRATTDRGAPRGGDRRGAGRVRRDAVRPGAEAGRRASSRRRRCRAARPSSSATSRRPAGERRRRSGCRKARRSRRCRSRDPTRVEPVGVVGAFSAGGVLGPGARHRHGRPGEPQREAGHATCPVDARGRRARDRYAQRSPSARTRSASVTFAPFTLAEPNVRGTVRAGTDALPQDNAFHFVLSPSRPVSVLIVDAPTGADPRREPCISPRRSAIGDDAGVPGRTC